MAYAIATVGVCVVGSNLIDARGRLSVIISSFFVMAASIRRPLV